MDIENTWKQSRGSDAVLTTLLQQSDFGNLHSKLPLKKLKNNLLIGIAWAVLVTVVYLLLFFYFSIWQVQTAFGSLIVFNIWIMLDTWKLYRNTNENISPSFSLKEELEKNYEGFQKWWSIQQKVSLFIYPVSAAGGFILGGVLGSGQPVETFLYNAKMLIILGITILILVPVCYYTARWMFNYAYGKHLEKLKFFIAELS